LVLSRNMVRVMEIARDLFILKNTNSQDFKYVLKNNTDL